MKNYVSKGENLKFTAPYALLSGEGALVGTLFGVALDDAANGTDVVLVTVGVFDLKAASADTPAAGAAAYWDNSAKQVTTTSSSNTKIGVFQLAKSGGAVVGRVRLNGSF